MTVTARLFDADGHDTEIDLASTELPKAGKRRLLWIDVDSRETAALERVAPQLDLSPRLIRALAEERSRPALVQFPEHILLSIRTLDDPDASASEEVTRDARPLDLVAGQDWVLTVHDGSIPAVDRILEGIEGETNLGALDADGFLAAIVDSVIVGYYRVIERIEGDIDRLDEAALRHRPGDDILARIVAMRRRISRVRQALTPHREAFAVLARPDFALHEELGQPWPGVVDRLEGAIDSVEQMRESLLGTYDIFMGRSSQRDSQVVTTLTVLSAILLPAVVIAGVMGMNFKLPFFDDASNFWVALGLMATLAVSILAIARWRHWV